MSDTTRDGNPHGADDGGARLKRLETILELAPVGIGLVDFEGRTTMTNSALRRMLGYSSEEFAALSWRQFTHPDDIGPNEALSRRLAAGEIDHFMMEKRFLRKGGGYLWAALTVSLVRDKDGNPDYEIGMTLDITERKRLESDLRSAEERFRLLVERVPTVVYIYQPRPVPHWNYISPQIETMFGITVEELTAEADVWLEHIDPTQRDEVFAQRRAMFLAGNEGQRHSSTYRFLRGDGETLWVRDDAMVLRDHDGVPQVHGVLVDVTEEKDLEERLGHQAYHDSLTGLPNRRLFHDRVDQALAGESGPDGGTVVLFIDLDNFKSVNDSFGHACGDEVIVAAAGRIKSCARAGDTAARLGGDEFGLLLDNVTVEQATALAARILATFHDTPVEFGGRTAVIAASIGVAAASAEGETTETLLRNADLAMYDAKVRGRGRYIVYEPSMHRGAMVQFRLAAALQAAVAADAITLAYQPIIDVHTGRVVGLEALARWVDPELGEVSPSEFIPVAEQTGLIQELGGQVLRRACAELAQWAEATGGDAYVSVNVSPLQLEDDEIVSLVVDTLADRGLAPERLVLEVTEGMLLQEHGREALVALRAHGVRVAIDDFGTGYSAISRLHKLPVDLVKTDQSFFGSFALGTVDHAFLKAIIALAETQSLTTISKRIETEEQLAAVRSTTCRYGQGYFVARPGPITLIPATLSVSGAVREHVG